MPPLLRFKQGWENENLARYILSRFSFVAQPSTVSDDIGADFYCTLFRVEIQGKYEYPSPLNSFAIQAKSNDDDINIKNIDYLSGLEIPYFVGVVNRDKLSLTIYSGEFLPMFFTCVGNEIQGLNLHLCKREDLDYGSGPRYFKNKGEGQYDVFLPEVEVICVNESRERFNQIAEKLKKFCEIIQRNIASKISCEYIYEYIESAPDCPSVAIQAGSGSMKHFRENFYKRLAEVFYNLEYMYDGNLGFDLDEYKLYEDFLHRLKERDDPIPPYLSHIYEQLKEKLQGAE